MKEYQIRDNMVLIRPEKFQTETESGIVLVTRAETEAREQRSATRGTVVGLGPTVDLCFEILERDENGKVKKARNIEIGDEIVFKRYAGVCIEDEEGEKDDLLWIMNDEDVFARVK